MQYYNSSTQIEAEAQEVPLDMNLDAYINQMDNFAYLNNQANDQATCMGYQDLTGGFGSF